MKSINSWLTRLLAGAAVVAVVAVVAAPMADIEDAFVRREFYLVYQPKISVRTGGFAGVEALARWKHPTLGTIPRPIKCCHTRLIITRLTSGLL